MADSSIAGNKRKDPPTSSTGTEPPKRTRQWRTPRSDSPSPASIEPGKSGIFATCDIGREGKCVGELRNLFEQYVEELYPEAVSTASNGAKSEGAGAAEDEGETEDIEASIKREVHALKANDTTKRQLLTPIRLEIPCVIFFAVSAPIDPVVLVHKICSDAVRATSTDPERRQRVRQQTRYTKRLTPITLTGKAFEKDLAEVATAVLKPVFHSEGHEEGHQIKFAIRPTLRNHSVLTRMSVIERVAELVGENGKVDLGNYEKLILVEVYRNILGISVVDADFDKLKKYNLNEIWSPSPTRSMRLSTNAMRGGEYGKRHVKDPGGSIHVSDPEDDTTEEVARTTSSKAAGVKDKTADEKREGAVAGTVEAEAPVQQPVTATELAALPVGDSPLPET